ncbi:MAG TPA: arsenate reductase [Gallionella sp.]|nr:arsenate reductase [Gallionella sp.]
MKGTGTNRLYGIPNCNTVKKARDWLAQHDIAVEFHDFKKLGLDASIAQNWLQQADWTKLINRSGLTWRGLPEERKQGIHDATAALALMLEKSSVIKRPLLEQNGKLLHVGFDEAAYSSIFNLHT